MKKKVFLSLLVVVSLFFVVGCGKKDSNMAGKYTMVEMKEGSTSYNAELLKQLEIEYTLEVKDDKTAVMDVLGVKQNLTYDDKYFTAKDDGEDSKISYTYKNGKITLKQDDMQMIFEKK